MNDINANLQANEEVVIEGKLSLGAVVVPLVLLILGAIGFLIDFGPTLSWVRIPSLVLLVIGIWGTIVGFARRLNTELVLTNHRILGQNGFPTPTSVDANLNKIDRIEVDRSMLGRLLGYATLVITLAGEGRGRQRFPQLNNAQKLAETIRSQISTRRSERR
jgi:uncharacterized membrane protein YdbT with pleckstrin-like domain